GDDASMVGGLSVVMLDNTNVDDTAQDFGYTPVGQDPGEGLIGDQVWFDEDRDGTFDPEEEGIEGVIVQLEDGNGNVIATAETNENGEYFFGGLPVDEDYKVVIASINFFATGVLSGLENTFDPDGNLDSEGINITLTTAEPINLDQDFGYVGNDALTLGSIGDKVFEDRDADGMRDADELGFEGVTLELYRDINGNGRLDSGEPLIGQATTDMNGMYLFDQLPLGAYIVDVTDEDGVLAGFFKSTSPNQNPATNGGNDPMDNSKEDAFAVTIGGAIPNNRNVDFGYYKDPAALGNFVFDDADGDGIQDIGEQGIEGVAVTLDITYPNGDMVTVVTTTDMDGFYEFPNLLLDEDYNGEGPNEPSYIISVDANNQDGIGEPLAGFLATLTDQGTNDLIDADDVEGVAAFPIQGNENTAPNADASLEGVVASYDFGFTQLDLVGIGGTLFDDRGQGGGGANDGTQNGTEPGLAGVTVVLLDENGDEVDRTTTDDDGNYLFTALMPGDYQLLIPSSNFGDANNPLNELPFSSVPTSTLDDDMDNDDNGIQTTSQGDVTSPLINLSVGNEPSGAQEVLFPNQDGSDNSTQDVNTNTTLDFGFQDLVLPVELLRFKAQADKDHIDLTWATASEINNSHFELERSEDGKTFKQIARIEGNGTTLETMYYDYEDVAVLANITYYYRLKQVDFDGVFEYSEIRTAQIAGAADGAMSIYPNPVGVTNNLNVRIFLQELSTEFYIMDIEGRIIKTIKVEVADMGWNVVEIVLNDLAAGTYFIGTDTNEVQEFIKAE
ncbi:MAG: SdrD B-like domain-containing protein, partial [Bacteroidota bacterium]